LVSIIGLATRHSLLALSRCEQVVREGQPWNAEALRRGAAAWSLPVIETTAVTAAALLPLALRGGKPGGEVSGPMATAILGGLVTAAVFQIFVLPPLVLRHGKFEDRVP
jgi:Cu/Ag efflux pump CusA